MSLRVILFGYKVVNGKIEILEQEAKTVREIFSEYCQGKSLSTIAAALTERTVVYYLDKTVWTKNMIARIIQNPKYAGADGYPPIISQTDFELANKRKSEMGGTQTELPEITILIKSKFVCSQCGHNIGRRNKWRSREKWLCPNGCKVAVYIDDKTLFSSVLTILNSVRLYPSLLKTEVHSIEYSPSIEVVRQGKEIDRVKEQTGVEFGVVAKMVLQCVSHKYEGCTLDRGRAMTDALMEKYRNLTTITELDMTLIRETVQRISLNQDGTVTVRFINNAEVSNNIKENESA